MERAALVAADAAIAATQAASSAAVAEATAHRHAAQFAALAELRCPPCGQPFASACVLPCGHALDEVCLLKGILRCAETEAFACPMCGDIVLQAPTRSPHIDAAVAALVDGDLAQSRRLRLAEALRVRETARNACRRNSKVDAILHGLLFGEALPPSSSEPPAAPAEELLCIGCGEPGHVHADCPHRSDIEDDDEGGADDEDEFAY